MFDKAIINIASCIGALPLTSHFLNYFRLNWILLCLSSKCWFLKFNYIVIVRWIQDPPEPIKIGSPITESAIVRRIQDPPEPVKMGLPNTGSAIVRGPPVCGSALYRKPSWKGHDFELWMNFDGVMTLSSVTVETDSNDAFSNNAFVIEL